jgi:sugar/nucleoside kinase (ribokinase family)
MSTPRDAGDASIAARRRVEHVRRALASMSTSTSTRTRANATVVEDEDDYDTERAERRRRQRRLVVVFGGAVMDVHARAGGNASLARGTSVVGRVGSAPGGVGMNAATACAEAGRATGVDVGLVTAVGNDAAGRALRESWTRRVAGRGGDRGVRVVRGSRTATVVGVLDGTGELAACVADVECVETGVDAAWCDGFAMDVREASIVVLDANLGREAIATVCDMCSSAGTALWYEPVSVEKSTRILTGNSARPMASVNYCSPNAAELRELANGIRRMWAKGSPMSPCPFNPEFEFETASDALNAMASDISTLLAAGVGNVVLTLGPLGVIVSSAPDGDISHATHVHVPAVPTRVVSLVGAGDALVGGTVAALAAGSSLIAAVSRGTACASFACETNRATLDAIDEAALEARATSAYNGVSLLAPAVVQ